MQFSNFSLLAVLSLLVTKAAGEVEPFDCDTYSGPLQVLQVGDSTSYDVRQLNFSAGSDGSYSLVYTIPTNGNDCLQFNGCGIHPFDDVPYCHCKRHDGLHSIVRFDEHRVEHVMFVDTWSYSSGFLEDGRFFVLSYGAMYEVSNLNTSNPSSRLLYHYQTQRQPSDIVFQTFDLLGDGKPRAYAVGFTLERTLVVFPLDEDCTNFDDSCSYVVEIVGSARNEDAKGYGAGWVFEGTAYFSDNMGSGVYKVTFENEVGEPLQARMSWVTRSETTNRNDGMVCYGQEDVFVGLPTLFPTPSPTFGPTPSPTTQPSDVPTKAPFQMPTPSPTSEPTDFPSITPSRKPTSSPTTEPSELPSLTPTPEPTDCPTFAPSPSPTPSPTSQPSELPSVAPSFGPSTSPTRKPSDQPSAAPTLSCLSFKMTCSDGYEGLFNIREEIWRSEWLEMSSNDVMKAEHILDKGFRWVVEAAGAVLIADSVADRFTEVTTWSGISCNFVCSPIRLTTGAPTPSAPSNAPTTVSPTSLPTSSTPSKSPESSLPSASPSQAPSSSMPTDVPSENPTISEPTELPTQAPTQTCLTFEFRCEMTTGHDFEGTYVRQQGWKIEFNQVRGGNAKFSIGFVGTSPRWIFSEEESALISDSYVDGAFDQIYSWSGNKCTIECSGSFPPTAFPIASDPSPAPTANEPSLMPTMTMPTPAPSSTSEPTNHPSFTSPSELPTAHPVSSDPTEFPSSSPTTPCLAFEAYCSNTKFNGVYNFNGYNRKWFLRDGDAIFSISALPDSSLAWIFEFPNDEQILHADYQSDFTSILSWSIHDRLSMVEIESAISCAFSCSVTVTPSTSPSTSLPTYTPTSPSPTSSTRYSLVLENHLAGSTLMGEANQLLWKEAISHLLHGPQEINIISMKSMVPDRRRALTNPELNVTAEVFFETQQDLDLQYSNLLNENDRMNSLLEIYLPMKGIDNFETVYIGLVGQFDGQYYVPTNMPTLLPTIDDNTEIVIIIEGPGDIDDITNVTDTVTGTNTTVISITDNGDGTTTVVIGCSQCNGDITTDVENGLEDSNISVISVNTRDGDAMNSGDSAAMKVVTSGMTWMIIALITASVLGIYLLWTGRRKMKRCLTCTKKQKVVDVPKDLEFEIAQANVLPANVLPRVMSESWTAATAVTRGNSFSSVWALEGDETRFDEDFSDDEGNLTIEINPARIQDGDVPTGYDEDDSEDGYVPTGFEAQPKIVDGYTTGVDDYGSDSDTALDENFEGDEFTRIESPSSPTAVMLDAPKRTVGFSPSYDSIYSDEGDAYYETRQDSPTATMLDAPKRTLGFTVSNDSFYGDEGDSEYYRTQPESPTATMLEAPKRSIGIAASAESITEYDFDQPLGKRIVQPSRSPKSPEFSFGGDMFLE